ncbi:hypothetical protein EON65_55590, partial [archaeon]
MTKADCLQRKYIIDPSQSYCRWQQLVYEGRDGVAESSGVYVVDNEIAETGYNECVFVDPSFSFTVIIYVSLLISLGTSVFIEPLEYATEILGSPLLHEGQGDITADTQWEVKISTVDSASDPKRQ